MKKAFPTVFDATAQEKAAICVSAGKIGTQVECSPTALAALVRGQFAAVTEG
jgi:Cys-tRNA(Pro)/Cys-tRNA(Cys) deacylase